ncbi:MAG TPA: gliding motility-associated C-terminal domain-containing protein, partial [Bacteroidia bacterium]|nr:gliding motility-associated C-terminal domain-containing protein [Bacteroidia bacterium]
SYSWSTIPVQTSQSAAVNPNVNTVYTLTVANNLCSITDTFKVNMLPSPTVTIKGRPTSCAGSTDTLTATSAVGKYVWSTGATTSSIIVPVNKDSTYFVVVKQGCADTGFYTVNVIPGSGIKVCCDTTIAYGGTASLTASGAVSYVWQPSNSVNCNCSSVTVNPGENTTYTVIGTDVNGCLNVDTVTVDIACASYFVPNVFTPNNDGQNDNFLIKAYGYSSYHIEIYDRWGLLEYTSDTPWAPWDGKDMSGVMVSDGVYYYIIKSVCGTKETDHDGFVHVIKQ